MIKRISCILLAACLTFGMVAIAPSADAASAKRGIAIPAQTGTADNWIATAPSAQPVTVPTYTPTATPSYSTTITWTNAAQGVSLNGVALTSIPLMNVNGVPYCSVKVFCQTILSSARVVWVNNGAKVTGVTAGGEQLTLTAQPGSQYMQVNGQSVYVPNGIKIKEGLTMVPIEQLANLFQGSSVGYDWTSNMYVVTTGAYLAGVSNQPTATTAATTTAGGYQPSGYYDPQALDLIARIINAEAGNLSLEGKVAVGNVIMNRVASSEFPNTVYGVIYQPNQFTVVYHSSFQRTPSEQSVTAAKMALDGVNYVPGAVFYNVAGLNTWASRNRPYLTTFAGHDFYL